MCTYVYIVKIFGDINMYSMCLNHDQSETQTCWVKCQKARDGCRSLRAAGNDTDDSTMMIRTPRTPTMIARLAFHGKHMETLKLDRLNLDIWVVYPYTS